MELESNKSLKLKGLAKPNKSLLSQVRTPVSGEVIGFVLSHPGVKEASSGEQHAASSLFISPSTIMPTYYITKRTCYLGMVQRTDLLKDRK